jgi:subfamily B ATP-binding cassette protein MsbA
MRLYLKILAFAKEFWSLIALSVFISLLYVLLNNLSLWVAVDFVKELFAPTLTSSIVSTGPATADTALVATGGQQVAGMVDKSKTFYKTIKQHIRTWMVRGDRTATLKLICLLIFLAFLVKNILLYARSQIIFHIQTSITNKLRLYLHSVFVRLPLAYLQKNPTGEYTSITFNDVNSINSVIQQSYGVLIMTPLQLAANLAILCIISWRLTLLVLIIIPVTGLLIWFLGQSIRRKSRRIFSQIAIVLSHFTETMSAIRVVKAFTGEARADRRFQDANQHYFNLLTRSNRLQSLSSPLNETIGAFVFVLLLWYGGSQVYAGTGMEAEDFTRFLVFLFMMFAPLKTLTGINNTMQIGMAAAERIFKALEETPEVYDKPGARRLDSFRTALVFENVSFRYRPDGPLVLHTVDLTIRKGEMVALVGPSGAGKSTLADLVPRFFEPASGRVLIDGIDTREYTLASLRQQIGIVSQESILFNDTVGANIAYGREGATEVEIIAAARAANAWEFIAQMDKGLATGVGERGVRISGGQKQRLSIARALLKDPPILILDEATSSLDTESERQVQEAIEKLMQNRTIVAIAHRLSTVLHADKIVVIEAGRIIDSGPHTRLLETCPLYRKLYEMQFQEPRPASQTAPA